MDKHYRYCSYMLINDQLASPRKFFKWCNLVRFGAYFHKNFTLKKSRRIHFTHKHNWVFINCSHVLARGFRSMKNEITFDPRSILFCTKSLLNAQK